MPAPEHLLPILERLGDGGTVPMAEVVHGMIEEARGVPTVAPAPPAIPPPLFSVPPDPDGRDVRRLAQHLAGAYPDQMVHGQDPCTMAIALLSEAKQDLRRLATVLVDEFDGGEPVHEDDPHGHESTTDRAIRLLLEQKAELAEGRTAVAETQPAGDTHQEQHDTYADGHASAADPEPDLDATQEHAIDWAAEAAIDWDDEPDAKQPAAETAPAPSAAASAADIRAWARDNDIDVPAKGFIPKTVRAQYDAAHPEA